MVKAPVHNESDLIDHMGIWLFLENETGEILMQFHNKFGCWTIPLEKSDPEETLGDAIVRAGKEELDIEITDYEVIHSQEDKYLRDGVMVKVVGNLVKVNSYNGTPRNVESEKHSEFG